MDLLGASGPTIANLLQKLSDAIVNPLIRLMFIVAFVMFLWGVVEFIRKSDSDEARTKGKQHMLWGVIGMAIMVGVQAIIKIAVGTINTLAR